jgi:hypothetical protein
MIAPLATLAAAAADRHCSSTTVRRAEMAANARACSGEVDTGSPKEHAPGKNLQPFPVEWLRRSGSFRSEMAVGDER